MSLKCRIYKDENGEIDFVEAANGSRSKLFDTLVNITGGNKNTALNLYALTEVEDFKDVAKAKVNSIKSRVGTLVKSAPEVMAEVGNVRFSRVASNSTYFSNAVSAINNLTDKNPKNTQGWVKQLTDTQKNGGVKNVNQELEWIGLEDYLNSYVKENSPKAGNIPASIVEDYIKANQIEIVDVSKGRPEIDINDLDAEFDGNGFTIRYSGEGNLIMPYITLDQIGLTEEDTYEEDFDYYSAQEDAKRAAIEEVLDREDGDVKYQNYQLKGGENYRELLLTMPSKGKDLESRYQELVKKENNDTITEEEIIELEDLDTRRNSGEDEYYGVSKEDYNSSHWDEANILAHVRMNEKTLPDGRKVLIVNEVQSDWAQEGRRKGFKNKEKEVEREVLRLKLQAEKDKVRKIENEISNLQPLTREEKAELNQEQLKLEKAQQTVRNNRDWEELGRQIDEIEGKLNNYEDTKNQLKSKIYSLKYEGQDAQSALEEELYNFDKENKDLFLAISKTPYANTDQWVGLATRRVLQMAAQEGYDGVAFATGSQSADMYSLAKQVDNISWDTSDNTLTAFDKDGSQQFQQSNVTDENLENFVGKEVAERLINRKENLSEEEEGVVTLENADLEIGGEGMKTFYNKIVPKVAQKEAQRFDKSAKLETVDFGEDANTNIYKFKDVKEIKLSGKPLQRYLRNSEGSEYLTISNLQMAIVNDMSELLLRNGFQDIKQAEEAANNNDEDGIAVTRIYGQAVKDHDLLAKSEIEDLEIEYYQTAESEKDKLALAQQPFIAITDKMKSELKASIPMFSRNLVGKPKNEILPQIVARLELSGLANNVYQMNNSQIENKLVELGEGNVDKNTAGFTYRGDIYLNTDVMSLDTPIHEFGHLHLDWLKENKTGLYQAGLSLIDKNKEEAQQYINIVKSTQPDLDEGTEEFNNEVLAQVIGDQGAKLILTNKKGSLSEWLKSVWDAIKEVVGLSNYTAEQVSAMTLAEFGTASAADILSNRFEGSRDFTDSQSIMYSVLSDYRDNQKFKYSDLIYPDVVFKDIANKSETKVATNFYKKIVNKFNKTFDRNLKLTSSEKVDDFTVTVEYETGLKPKYFAYPTAVMGEHVTVDNIDKNVPLTSLRHELVHEMLVKNITDKFERINNLDNSANIISIEEVQRNRAYNYTLEDVFFERVVENVERNPDNQDTFEVSTFGTDIINRVKKELEGIPMTKENVMGTLEDLFEGSNPWLKTTVLDIFENKVDYSVEDLSQLNDEVGKMFKQRFDLSRDIFTKDLQAKIFEFASFFNEEYTGVLTRLNKIEKRNKLTRVVPGNTLFVDSLPAATTIANSYMREMGLPLSTIEKVTKLDINTSEIIAREFENMVDERGNLSSETKAAYDALIEETLAQYEKIVDYRYEMEVNNNEPYSSSKEMIEDLRDNKRMKVFSTEAGFGVGGITAKQKASDPRLVTTKFKDVNGYPLLFNDIFRFVHDFFGHAKLGNGFGAIGEENAWNIHSKMYSPLAKRAMTTETRGQNSWVNFSGVNDEAFALRDKARTLRKEGDLEGANALTSQVYDMMKFADQKIGLMPLWVSQSDYRTVEDRKTIEVDGSKVYFKNQVNPVNGEVTGKIEVELVETPKELRGAGRARKALKTALKYTDSIGKDTVLTISSRDKLTTEKGLEKFYTSLGYQKTSDFEMERPAKKVLPIGYDENEEPSIKDLMEYANSSEEMLSLEDTITARNTAIALGVKSSGELVAKLEKAFVKDGIFIFDKVSLQRNGVFNKYESSKILSSLSLQKSIKQAYLQLKNTEPFVLEYNSDFVKVSGSDLNIFGKQPVDNPFTVEVELAKDIAGLTDENISENLVPELATKYNKNTKFKDAVNNIAKNNRLVNIKVVKDDQLVDKVEDVKDTLENVLIDTDNLALSENIRSIKEDFSEEVWDENLNLVIKVLASIKKNAVKNGIDLRDITTKVLSNSRQDILDFLDTMENLFQYGMNEETVNAFSEAYKTIFELDTVETDLIQTDSEFDNIVESNLSEYQLFDKFGLVKKQGDIYRQTEEQSLEELYDAMFENKELFPERITTVDSLKEFVEKEVGNLEIADYEIDPDKLAKMYLYKKYFGFSLVAPTPRVSIDKIGIVTSAPEYLVTEFVKDFNKWILDTKNNYFKVTNKGIELVEKDPLSKEEALLTIPEEYKKDLAEYDAISKNLNLGIESEELVFSDYDSQTEQREFFANNPQNAKKLSGDYLYIEEGVLAVKNETDTFIRTPQGVFEMIYEAGNIKFYNRLPMVDPNFKFVGLEKPLSDVDFNKYQYLENTPEVFKTAKTYYSRKELDQIDEDYFNCQ